MLDLKPVVTVAGSDQLKLPGAIFFVNVKPKNTDLGRYSIVAYDPFYQHNEGFVKAAKRWVDTETPPYIERFTEPKRKEGSVPPPDNLAQWRQGRAGGHYFGIFGQNASEGSKNWPYSTDSPAKGGVLLTFIIDNNKKKYIYASKLPATARFAEGATFDPMPLEQYNGWDFIKSGKVSSSSLESAVIEYAAIQKGHSIGEKIIPSP